MFTQAVARKPGKNFARGITTTVSSQAPSYDMILKQHAAYLETLKFVGLDVRVLDPLADYPDAYFVEDTAVVTRDVAVITNPGAASRRGEEISIAAVLSRFRKIEHIQPPGTMDGGDVLQVDSHFFIGLSERTNQAGATQFGRMMESCGNTWTTVPVAAGLHFKSSVNYVGKDTLLVTAEFAGQQQLKDYRQIVVGKGEEYAANTLFVNGRLLMPKGYPQTRKQLEILEYEIIELDVSEVRKMDGGLTCLSIRF
jgi:dimethylargininase